jgi:hypothetical protein
MKRPDIPQALPSARRRAPSPAWLAVVLLLFGLLGPALTDPCRLAPGPYGGVDALLQAGLLEWSARHWLQPSLWPHVPIFHPARDMIAAMDSLLGQALAVAPWRWLLPTVAARYNAAFLASLVLAAAAMAWLWRAAGGGRSGAPVAALALLGAPMTIAHLGHLNQLPPPGVPAAAAALAWASARQRRGLSPRPAWWALAAVLPAQASWGWYGCAESLLVTVCLLGVLLAARDIGARGSRRGLLAGAALPVVLGLAAMALAAWPYLRVAAREASYERTISEIRWYSADLKHLINTGAHRSEPADWLGRGAEAAAREARSARQVLHPGWIALALACLGWFRRRDLSVHQRRLGNGLLLAGGCGLVLAFGDSAGVPGTGWRVPLPLGLLHDVFPPARAFRAAWRFGQLATVATAWWAAAGWTVLRGTDSRPAGRRRLLPAAVVLALLLESWPAGVPAVAIPDAGTPPPTTAGAVLTLPAPADVYGEDAREAAWLLRALATGRPVTGGASGWVPPATRALRRDLAACERGERDPRELLAELRGRGVTSAQMRADDPDPRLEFWRAALRTAGAVPGSSQPHDGFEMWDLPPPDAD